MYLHKTKNGHYTPPCCYFSGELEVVEILRSGLCGNDIEESNPLKKALKCFLMRGATGYFAGGQSAVKYFEYYGANRKRIHLHNFTSLHQEDINKKLL